MTGQRLFLGDMTGAGREAGPEVLVWWGVWCGGGAGGWWVAQGWQLRKISDFRRQASQNLGKYIISDN